jgi:hypothetical protein
VAGSNVSVGRTLNSSVFFTSLVTPPAAKTLPPGSRTVDMYQRP